MIHQIARRAASIAVLLLASSSFAQSPPPATPAPPAIPGAPPTDQGWPRTFTKEGTTAILHQPQIDSWKDYDKIRFRCAVEVTPAGAGEPNYGVVAVQGDTEVSHDTGTVIISNMQVAVRFPGIAEDQATTLSAQVKELLPNRPFLTVSLARVLAYMHDAPPPAGVQLNLAPPPIYYSATPAILVNFMGQPEFKPIKDTKLMFAVNTNWLILMDMQGGQYYLLNNKSWLSTSDPLKGPWAAAGTLPSEFSSLPAKDWQEVVKNMPGVQAKVVPNVIVSTEPAELIVTSGTPDYTPIYGTSLMYVSNPTMPVFMDMSNSNYYYLVAGRWFSAPALTGPWSAASASLPAEFARIPDDSPVSFVLPSVPGTQDARDAVLLAQVPHKATVTVSDVHVTVTYQGAPKFVVIDGTSMKYAVNTAYQVIFANNGYYCCYNGIWFSGPAATGPWVVCTSIPAVIYTIPPSCPVYNCTYVLVYSSTPTTVVVGSTSGYSGEYVAATGALMFGAGMLVGAAIANNNDCWHPYYPSYYSYGCAPCYHYGYGGYCSSGYAHYGPYGGAGYTAGYNPSTGTYSRSAYASNAYGSASVHQAYNPYTNTYAAHGSASNAYGSWGGTTVSQGDKWASGEHYTSSATGVTHGWAENSSGESTQYAHKSGSTVGATSSGDLYAGHDGNVYKNTGSGWQSYDNGNWNSVQKPSSTSSSSAQHPPSSSSQSAWKNGSGSTSDMQNKWNSSSRSSGGDSWGSHDTQSSLNHDSWSRSQGNSSHSWGGGGGGGGSGGGGRSWGGGGGRGRR